jgi:hypothetical protein
MYGSYECSKSINGRSKQLETGMLELKRNETIEHDNIEVNEFLKKSRIVMGIKSTCKKSKKMSTTLPSHVMVKKTK